jgi:hypothetical protein
MEHFRQGTLGKGPATLQHNDYSTLAMLWKWTGTLGPQTRTHGGQQWAVTLVYSISLAQVNRVTTAAPVWYSFSGKCSLMTRPRPPAGVLLQACIVMLVAPLGCCTACKKHCSKQRMHEPCPDIYPTNQPGLACLRHMLQPAKKHGTPTSWTPGWLLEPAYDNLDTLMHPTQHSSCN